MKQYYEKKGVGAEGENDFPSTVRKQDRVSDGENVYVGVGGCLWRRERERKKRDKILTCWKFCVGNRHCWNSPII